MAMAGCDAYGALRELRDQMEQRIKATASEAIIYGAEAPRVANTSLVGLPGLDADLQVMTLDLAGIAVSAGAACSSGKVAPSHVLIAMGVDQQAAHSAVRISMGPTTAPAEIDQFLAVWSKMRSDAAGRIGAASVSSAA